MQLLILRTDWTQHLILRLSSEAIPNLPEINEESLLSSFLTLVTRITIDVMLSND